MIELNNNAQMERAVLRAKAESRNLLVRVTNVKRRYTVENRQTGKKYEINFTVSALGKRYGACTCAAGANLVLCKHIACAASLNICLVAQGLFKSEHQCTN